MLASACCYASKMLQSLKVCGYRGLRDFTLQFAKNLPTVLIGENASGKSSILDAIEVFSTLINGSAAEAISRRGGIQSISWGGEGGPIMFELVTTAGVNTDGVANAEWKYRVVIDLQNHTPVILTERLTRVDWTPPNDSAKTETIFLEGGPDPTYRGINGEAVRMGPSGSNAFRTQLGQIGVRDRALVPEVFAFRESVKNVRFVDGFSDLTRQDKVKSVSSVSVEDAPEIDRSGGNLLNAMYTLKENQPNVWRDFQRDVEAVFPWCSQFQFPASNSARGVITMKWCDQRSGKWFYLSDMSDGMRVYLANLLALHASTDPAGVALITFDEIEKHLHPRALRYLLRLVHARSESCAILIATHSDRLLGYLDNLPASIRVVRFHENTGVKIDDHLSPQLLEEWLHTYSAVELRQQNLLDGPTE